MIPNFYFYSRNTYGDLQKAPKLVVLITHRRGLGPFLFSLSLLSILAI